VDREFVLNLDRKPEDAALVRAIVQLAHSFNMKVVAEGVEEQSQYHFLQGIGCDYVQGYLLGKPVSGSRLFAQLEYIRSQSQLVQKA
jgi:EAL domain-containing protein (putative c-di-GMP-specific phosphodiesterase class I)